MALRSIEQGALALVEAVWDTARASVFETEMQL
jgi:hypothetical protein